MFQCFLITSEKGGVEDRVDLPLGGDAEAEHRAGNDFFNLKWASPLHLKFLGSAHMKVGGFQPDLISYFPWGIFGDYLLFHLLLGQFMSSLGIIASSNQVGESAFQIW